MLWLLETLVDPRFRRARYRTAYWMVACETTGRGRAEGRVAPPPSVAQPALAAWVGPNDGVARLECWSSTPWSRSAAWPMSNWINDWNRCGPCSNKNRAHAAEVSQHFLTRTRQQQLPGGVLQSLADTLYAHLQDQRQAPCPCCDQQI